MARDVSHVSDDMLTAIVRIQELTKDHDGGSLPEDWRDYWAVQRALEIISEASRSIPAEMQTLRSEIRWQSVRSFGNVLRHEYHDLAHDVIWNVVVDELPPLKIALLALREGNS